MRVVCDSCGATYKIPDTKLVKDVNRATCRKCGHRMLIKKPDAPVMGAYPSAATEEERTVIASAADLERRAREHLAAAQAATGTRLGARPPHAEEDPTIVKTLASPPGGSAGLSVGRPRTEVPAAPARIQRRAPDEPPTTVSSSIERMPERHVSQLGPAQPIPHSPRPPVEDGLKSGAVFDAPRGGPASFDAPRGGPASFDAPRGGGGYDPNADSARRAAAGRQAVVIDQAMRPPVPVAPAPQPAPAAHSGFPNGGAGAAMPAPMTPAAAPPRRSGMGGLVAGAVILALLGTAGAAAYIFTRTPVDESPERVDKVTTEQPAEEAPVEAAPAEEAPAPEEAAPVEATPEPTPEVAEAAPPPVEPEPVVEKTPEPPPKPSSRSSRSSSRSSTASKSTPPPSSAIEIPEPPAATKSVAAAKTATSKPTAPEVSDDDLLGGSTTTTPASKPAPAVVPPPPVAEEEPTLDTLPLTVLDTIVRNNKNIKRCFFNEQQKTGVLPSVSVKMKIETSGSVSSASIAEPAAQQGTELDACLSSAFKGLQFPAFKTPMGAVTDPFKF